jgi:ribonuclease VapC
VIVLDASALLARFKQEPGWDVVATAAAAEDATVSSVNYSETLQKVARLGVQPELVDSHLDALGITVSQFGRLDARLTASFYRQGSDLSLGDRACLALARNLSSPAYTADREWLNWASQLVVDVRVIPGAPR